MAEEKLHLMYLNRITQVHWTITGGRVGWGNQSGEISQEVMAIIQGGLEQDGSSAGGEKWLGSEYFEGRVNRTCC